jgi:endonuclease/exonuclease/phosphatase family metal-dependent hydrolase
VPELTVATFNVHWGRGAATDGYPPFDVVEACRTLDADVLTLQETWAPDDGPAQHDEVAGALGYEVRSVALSRAEAWPKPHVVSPADPERRRGHGDWCLALLSRPRILRHRTHLLPQLRIDPSSRAVIAADLEVEGTPLTVVTTHFSHLEFGSPRHRRPLRAALPATDGPAVLLGDMNMWGWTIDAMTPRGWRRAVGGRTWPAGRPLFQIDHVLVTDSVTVLDGEVLPDLGSDHRALRARIQLP